LIDWPGEIFKRPFFFWWGSHPLAVSRRECNNEYEGDMDRSFFIRTMTRGRWPGGDLKIKSGRRKGVENRDGLYFRKLRIAINRTIHLHFNDAPSASRLTVFESVLFTQSFLPLDFPRLFKYYLNDLPISYFLFLLNITYRLFPITFFKGGIEVALKEKPISLTEMGFFCF
jgi:hypothetical protein